jgi:HSP20 family protein
MLTRLSDWTGWPNFGFADHARSFGAFDQLRQEVDRLLNDFAEVAPQGSWAAPRLHFEDTGAAFVVKADLPGLAEKDLDLSVTSTTLTLRGERKLEPPQGYTVHRNERNGYRFARSFELPAKVDADKVEAKLVNGVLEVTLPKAEEARPKQITVKAG